MRDDKIRFKHVIIYMMSRLAGVLLGGSISWQVGKYFIDGVTAERGYEAIGGEYIMLALLFASFFYFISNICETVLVSLSEMLSDDDI